MGPLVKGDVVVIPFPFSDLSATKRRPALVIATLPGDDVMLCQITSQAITHNLAIAISAQDFADGSLHQSSNVRPERLFTADSHIIAYRVGSLTPAKMREVTDAIIRLITA
jgi:mRNA interferase MazF